MRPSKSLLKKPCLFTYNVSRLLVTSGFLEGHGLLFTHGRDDCHEKVLSVLKGSLNVLAQITLGYLDVVLGRSILSHEVEETIIDVHELQFNTVDIGDIHVVGGGGDIFELLAGEDLVG